MTAKPGSLAANAIARSKDPSLVMYEVVFTIPDRQKLCPFGEQRKRFDTREQAEVFVKMNKHLEQNDRFLGIVKGTRAEIETMPGALTKQQLMEELVNEMRDYDGKMAHECEWKVGYFTPDDNNTIANLRGEFEPMMFPTKEKAHACSRFLDRYCYAEINDAERFVIVQVDPKTDEAVHVFVQKRQPRN